MTLLTPTLNTTSNILFGYETSQKLKLNVNDYDSDSRQQYSTTDYSVNNFDKLQQKLLSSSSLDFKESKGDKTSVSLGSNGKTKKSQNTNITSPYQPQVKTAVSELCDSFANSCRNSIVTQIQPGLGGHSFQFGQIQQSLQQSHCSGASQVPLILAKSTQSQSYSEVYSNSDSNNNNIMLQQPNLQLLADVTSASKRSIQNHQNQMIQNLSEKRFNASTALIGDSPAQSMTCVVAAAAPPVTLTVPKTPDNSNRIDNEDVRTRIWSLTTEYENLLQIQNEHFDACMRSKDAEIEQLRGTQSQTTKDGPVTEHSNSAQNEVNLAEDLEVSLLALDERDKEIRLYKCLLEIRDKQLMELQRIVDSVSNINNNNMNNSSQDFNYNYNSQDQELIKSITAEKNQQIQTLIQELSEVREELRQARAEITVKGSISQQYYKTSSPSIQVPGNQQSSQSTAADVRQLQQEKVELEQIILSKEKQIQALTELSVNTDGENSDIGALQLGAKAIAMYTDKLELRQMIKDKDQIITQLQIEAEGYVEKLEQLQADLDSKRKDITDHVDMIGEKTRQILGLENQIQSLKQKTLDKGREVDLLKDSINSSKKTHVQEMSAKARVLEELKIELSNRDQCILEEKAEKVRLETLNQDLIKRNADTLQELKQNQGTLDHLMAHSRQQSQLVKDMTCQVQETETKLHTIQVQEMYEKRRRELQTRIREEETSQIIQDKDKVLSQLSMELNETRDRLGNIRKDLEQPSGMLNRSMISMASIRSPKNELPRVSQSPKGGDVETSSVHHILASLSKRNANGPKGTNNNSQSPLNRGGNITSMSYTNDSFNSGDVPLEFGNDEAPSQVQQQNDHLNTQYQPYPDDPIDATLSAYLQHNVKHIPLFCRLSSGIYLYGTNRIEMRLQPGGGAGPGGHSGVEILQALAPDGTTWILLEDLLREKLDSAQRLLGS